MRNQIRLKIIKSEIRYIMQNQSDMEDIEIEPKDRCDDKTMKSVISEIGKKS